MILDIDAHLELVSRHNKRTLAASAANDLRLLIDREPMLTVQASILQVINGKLAILSAMDLTKENALVQAAKLQGEINGLRMFFDILGDLLAEAEDKGTIS